MWPFRKKWVVGLDEDNNDELSLINFDRIKGGKPFTTDQVGSRIC
ncbi:MAG: hypothetical protein CM1200mP10_02850 [Candidatus Neomarinimicrobiota bacterium]|nr:MAG: hypothetical protein CM1200mP10_02850 [Candidatus Neomarinimicrobiota bacterium]